MNLGHSSEISRAILAYPYPGRSAKIKSGRGFPGQRISKKLMLRVRPGVELVRASLVPTRELIRLDFPTLERPRKATSGTDGAGKCVTSVAAATNRDKTLMSQFATVWDRLARQGPSTALPIISCHPCSRHRTSRRPSLRRSQVAERVESRGYKPEQNFRKNSSASGCGHKSEHRLVPRPGVKKYFSRFCESGAQNCAPTMLKD